MLTGGSYVITVNVDGSYVTTVKHFVDDRLLCNNCQNPNPPSTRYSVKTDSLWSIVWKSTIRCNHSQKILWNQCFSNVFNKNVDCVFDDFSTLCEEIHKYVCWFHVISLSIFSSGAMITIDSEFWNLSWYSIGIGEKGYNLVDFWCLACLCVFLCLCILQKLFLFFFFRYAMAPNEVGSVHNVLT